MRRHPPGRESHRHEAWRLDPPVRVLQLWPSLACGGQTTTGDGCLSMRLWRSRVARGYAPLVYYSAPDPLVGAEFTQV